MLVNKLVAVFVLMAHVDFFSRNSISSAPSKLVDKISEKRVDLPEISGEWLLAASDSELAEIVAKLQSDEVSEDLRKTYELRSGTLYRKIQRNGTSYCLPIAPRAFR